MIAALYVAAGGCYYGLDGVEHWGLPDRDARLYAGPWPVVAHPPCERWGRFAAVNGQFVGDDNGCFAAALASVRKWGGVLEHPCDSHAWRRFGLRRPPRKGGWVQADQSGGWTCCIEQGAYGHRGRKATWLYAVGVRLPDLRWGRSETPPLPACSVASALARGVLPSRVGGVAVLSRKQRAATPIEFRDLLLAMARSVREAK